MSYTPLKADEQDAIQRMVEEKKAYVEIAGWGYHTDPTITAGDKRIQVRFQLEFSKPEGIQVPVKFFTMRLKLRDGRTVFEDTKSVMYNNQPLMVTAGIQMDLVWDISVDKVDDEFKKILLPGIRGKKVMSIENGKVEKTGE